MLSRILTSDCLAKNPRVIDPACGSGIFLVEAFRRIVRYRVQIKHSPLTFNELKQIIHEQICGIELSKEAIRVAAFSLYLALLHYREPPSIMENPKLPHLIWNDKYSDIDNCFAVFIENNTFCPTITEEITIKFKLTTKRKFKGHRAARRLIDQSKKLPINNHSFDIVVGNPPWNSANILSRSEWQNKEHRIALDWNKFNNHLIGDKSYSQLFILRALSLVKQNGIIGLLVHSSVIFNQAETSKYFRQDLLSKVSIKEIINFAHVRHDYFTNAIAPFIFLLIQSRINNVANEYVIYSNVRRTRNLFNAPTVIFNKADQSVVRQIDFAHRDYLWKTYWWGNHRDAALLAALDLETKLSDFVKGVTPKPGFGFQLGTVAPIGALVYLPVLKSHGFKWYGPLSKDSFELTPKGTKRQPDERLYYGQRLIVAEGIKGDLGVCPRLESIDFSFRHTFYCVPLPNIPEWKAKVILGIILSSLGRYHAFMTSGAWGTWHEKINSGDILFNPD